MSHTTHWTAPSARPLTSPESALPLTISGPPNVSVLLKPQIPHAGLILYLSSAFSLLSCKPACPSLVCFFHLKHSFSLLGLANCSLFGFQLICLFFQEALLNAQAGCPIPVLSEHLLLPGGDSYPALRHSPNVVPLAMSSWKTLFPIHHCSWKCAGALSAHTQSFTCRPCFSTCVLVVPPAALPPSLHASTCHPW